METKEIEIQENKIGVYIKGEYKEKDKNAVAIIGAREATPKGKNLAHKYAYMLAKEGITIVSGLARGIDTFSHRGALDAKGRTIAVLGTGIDIVYPPENKDLAARIIKSGCLITTFPEGTKPIGTNFLKRNQLIAGLSKAVLVIEGDIPSGTLSTAKHAADLGIEVFAVAGSPATDWLIERGATVVNSHEEVLNYIHGR